MAALACGVRAAFADDDGLGGNRAYKRVRVQVSRGRRPSPVTIPRAKRIFLDAIIDGTWGFP
jgi:hypothetical protein